MTLTEMDNPTDILMKAELPSASFAKIDFSVSNDPLDYEPCISFVVCSNCPDGDEECVTETSASYIDDPMSYRNLTTYGTELQYRCPLAKEFNLHNNYSHTESSINMTCQWNETWTPLSTLPDCVCKCK